MLFDGTPLLQCNWRRYHFGLATVLDLNDFVSRVIAVSVNTTAYIAEMSVVGFNRSWIRANGEPLVQWGCQHLGAVRQSIPQAMKIFYQPWR